MLERLKLTLAALSSFIVLFSVSAVAFAEDLTFPLGTATPSETCGACHSAIYREYTLGTGSDNRSAHAQANHGNPAMPAKASSSATAHATALAESRGQDKKDFYCDSCHFPDPFNITGKGADGKLKPKTASAANGGLTCASCHLTPEGNIRAAHATSGAPHKTVVEPALQSSIMCGHCHGYQSPDKRVPGKMFQTFLEWQEDYYKPGLGKDQCQDCHMPRTLRKTAEDFDVPPRSVGRHTWTGAHSRQRHLSSLGVTIVQPYENKQSLDFAVVNIGAGHSVPTGEPSRAVYLQVEVSDKKGVGKDRREWMFAPTSDGQTTDVMGPHESSIRAGEERTLRWDPSLAPGEYTVKARLLYCTDRFQTKPVKEEVTSAELVITAK